MLVALRIFERLSSGMFNCQKTRTTGKSGFVPITVRSTGQRRGSRMQEDLAGGLTCALYREDGGGVKQEELFLY